MISNFSDKSATRVQTANFLHELLLNKRLIILSGGFLGRLISPLLKTGLPLMKAVLHPLAKRVFIPLGLSLSSAAAGIHKKYSWIGASFGFSLTNNNIDDLKQINGKYYENS